MSLIMLAAVSAAAWLPSSARPPARQTSVVRYRRQEISLECELCSQFSVRSCAQCADVIGMQMHADIAFVLRLSGSWRQLL